jgi:hypothetical protein
MPWLASVGRIAGVSRTPSIFGRPPCSPPVASPTVSFYSSLNWSSRRVARRRIGLARVGGEPHLAVADALGLVYALRFDCGAQVHAERLAAFTRS